MNWLILIDAAVLGAMLAFVLNWLALMPWREAKDRHWTERARLHYPARVSALGNLWVIPITLTIGTLVLRLDNAPPWPLTAVAATLGTTLGTLPMDHECCPERSRRGLLTETARTMAMRFLIWFVFIAAVAAMPAELKWQCAVITTGVFALWILWVRSGWIWVGRTIGCFAPAPERLQRIVDETSARLGVPAKEVLLIRSSIAQAYAVPGTGRLLFTERITEVLSDAELASIAAHELGHLTESRAAISLRYTAGLMFLPWLFLNPALALGGIFGLMLLMLCTIFVPLIYNRFSQKLERRADSIAKDIQGDPGTYARALLRIHEDNLLPAVMPKQRQTHPHLYDRMLNAGVTPDFPRPAPPSSMAWNGTLMACVLAILLCIWLFARPVFNW